MISTVRFHIVALETCERMSAKGSWEALQNMQSPRALFHPCEFNKILYLCGYPSNAIEAFSLVSSSFFTLPHSLPEESSDCCLAIEYSQLLILSRKHVTRYNIGAENQITPVASTSRSYNTMMDSSMPPVVDTVNGLVYLCRGGVYFCAKLDGGESRQIGR